MRTDLFLEALVRCVPDFRDGRRTALGATAERIEVKNGRVAGTAYSLRLRNSDGSEEVRPAFQAREGLHRVSRGASGEITHLGDPARLAGEDAATGNSLWVSPADPVMEFAGPDSGGPERIRILGHRFGKRITCCVRHAAGHRTIHKRFARPPAPATVDLLRRPPAGLRRPRVLGRHADGHGLTLELLRGRALHDTLRGGAAPDLRGLSAALATLRDESLALAAWSPGDELDVVAQMAARAGVVDPGIADRILQAREALPEPPAGRTGPCHRDLHDKQVLRDDDGEWAVLDWDLACVAAEELDPANLRAHFRLRRLQGVISASAERTLGASLDAGRPPVPGAEDRAAWWETTALLRLAAVYTLRPRWPRLGEALLREALQPMEAAR